MLGEFSKWYGRGIGQGFQILFPLQLFKMVRVSKDEEKAVKFAPVVQCSTLVVKRPPCFEMQHLWETQDATP